MDGSRQEYDSDLALASLMCPETVPCTVSRLWGGVTVYTCRQAACLAIKRWKRRGLRLS